jgi:excisionase family DNA binding protein
MRYMMIDQIQQQPTATHADLPRYLTVRQASRVLCVSSWLLYRAIRVGELAAIRWGRRVVLDREDLAALVAAKRDPGIAERPLVNAVASSNSGRPGGNSRY